MIEVHAFATPNSVKVLIALEEMGVAYELKPVNVRKGEQRDATFIALNPNGKVPVLVDEMDGERFVLTESAAILVYLAEKTGKLLPQTGAARARVFEQIFFHASGLSPAFGNAGFFKRSSPEPQPIAEARFTSEAERILGLLDATLAGQAFAAGDEFTIADIAHFGWLWRRQFPGLTLDGRPNLSRWYDEVAARPAVQRAIARVEAIVPAA
ncbi:glutathione S-transferase family protein [Roseixanthobacter glucoisosaccharinicivorans]|uniref:glutathione S-transferase family protein n=1 Tax=Roseixanthobacter glucoisosaccharinicivorans TaxID=3119923 RepID=UPI003729537F